MTAAAAPLTRPSPSIRPPSPLQPPRTRRMHLSRTNPRPAATPPTRAGVIALALGALGSPVLVVLTPAHAQVTLRGSAEPYAGEVAAVSPAGVRVRLGAAPADGAADPATLRELSWDRVRTVDGPLSGEALRLRPIADALFRARARLERGDWPAADDALNTIPADAFIPPGASASVLHEATMRVRLERGWRTGALAPWLRWRSNRLAAPVPPSRWVGGIIDLPPVIDPATALPPRLPPIFSAAAQPTALRALADDAPWPTADSLDPASRELAALYRHAARVELARLPSPPVDLPSLTALTLPRPTSQDDAVQLVLDIVEARAAAQPGDRSAARNRLKRRLDAAQAAWGDELAADPTAAASTSGPPPWTEAWIRAALGRSLLLEPETTARRLGIVELLHVPSRFAGTTPELARLCLVEALAALRELDDRQGAAAIANEIDTLFGGLPDEVVISTASSAPPPSTSPASPAPSAPSDPTGGP